MEQNSDNGNQEYVEVCHSLGNNIVGRKNVCKSLVREKVRLTTHVYVIVLCLCSMLNVFMRFLLRMCRWCSFVSQKLFSMLVNYDILRNDPTWPIVDTFSWIFFSQFLWSNTFSRRIKDEILQSLLLSCWVVTSFVFLLLNIVFLYRHIEWPAYYGILPPINKIKLEILLMLH